MRHMTIAAARQQSTGSWTVPLAVLIVGMFMSVLDTSIVNVAIPHIQTELGASSSDVEWVVTGYTLTLGVVVPVSSWLGQRIGLTRLYLMCLIGFASASALCGLAWNLNTLIAFRILQAIPGGVLPVITMTILYQIVPPKKIGSAMAMYGLGLVFAPAVGPTLGGWLVQYVDWRLIFYINVPVGILGAIAAFAIFPRIHPTSWPKFDLWGFLTVGYGLFALLLATSEGQDWGWGGYRVLMLLVSSALSLAAFVVIELEVESPLLDVRAFRCWPFTNSLLLIGVIMVGMFAVLYYIPQFLQVNQGMEALNAGLVLMPSALVTVALMPTAGLIYDRFGPRWPAVIGLLFMAYGSLLLARLTTATPPGDIMLWTSIRNIGTGLALMPIMTAGVAALPRTMVGAGSALNNVAQRVSSSLGIAVFGALLASQQAQLLSDRGGLLGSNPASNPTLGKAMAQGASGLYPIYRQLTQRIAATTYANIFLIVAWLCAIGVVLALLLRNGQPTPATPTQTAPVSIDPVSIDTVSIDRVPAEPVREPVPVGAGRRETSEEAERRRNQEAAKAASGGHI
jgi:EmrB/QacA subfamily drug resistance transporter